MYNGARDDARSIVVAVIVGGMLLVAGNVNDDQRSSADKLANLPAPSDIATKAFVEQQASLPLYQLQQLKSQADGNESRSRNAVNEINRVCQELRAKGVIDLVCNTQNALLITPGRPGVPEPTPVKSNRVALKSKSDDPSPETEQILNKT